MTSPTDSNDPGAAYAHARAQLQLMDRALAADPVDLMALAKAYAQLAAAMVQVARAAGHTSARFDAVAKALDLRTTKTGLRRFLEDA